jgi:hypothetical protein
LNELTLAGWPNVSSNYFDVMKIPLRTGRLFRDEGETEKVAGQRVRGPQNVARPASDRQKSEEVD